MRSNGNYLIFRSLLMATGLVILIAVAVTHTAVATSVNNISPEPKVSFTFDDGLASTLTRAAPVLSKYGFAGTSYVITDCAGSKGTCAANQKASYMTWDQIKTLQDEYKWEIGSHTASHPSLSSLSADKQDKELSASKQTLADHGIDATSFASPYGDYNQKTIALAAKYYQSHRGFWDKGANPWPYNEYLLSVQQIQTDVTMKQVKTLVDTAAKQKRWLIFVFHDIKDDPSLSSDDFEYATSNLDQIAKYVHEKRIPVSTIGGGSIQSNVNLLPNGGFEKGLSQGWSTDTPHNIIADHGDNGSSPDPKNSLLITASAKSTHLFSPMIAVNSDSTYMIKSFLNVTKAVNGSINYYVDEYDDQGAWISGQWHKAETTAFAENMNFSYRPSSKHVTKARLQLYLTPGSGIRAYVDSFQWFPMKRQ
jgi:Predicted xylanase/chitin deacetylase